MKATQLLLVLTLVTLAGCRHMGPNTIVQDRISYNDAIATSWKTQTLLNIVRIRYGDMAEFVDVSSIVNGYELNRTTSGNFGATNFPHAFIANLLTFGLSGSRSLTDRPTITYTPQTGSEFTKNLISPIPPSSILSLIEGGTSADAVMDLAVDSINGIRNSSVSSGKVVKEDPNFDLVLRTIRKAHGTGDVSFRVRPGAGKKSPPEVVMIFQDKASPAVASEVAEMRKVLKLDPDQHEFKVVFGMTPERNKMFPDKNKEIALRTRSVLRVMTSLSMNVQVPISHLADGRAVTLADAGADPNPQLTVYSSCKKPCDAFAAVHYQGYWFWVEQSDRQSKRSLSYLRTFLALADTGKKDSTPLVTIRGN